MCWSGDAGHSKTWHCSTVVPQTLTYLSLLYSAAHSLAAARSACAEASVSREPGIDDESASMLLGQ